MNENDQASVPPPIAPNPPTPAPRQPSYRPLSWWLRKLFACNPFYLASAALLLFGCYRISLDAPFLNGESHRLLFNFSSVQTYEVLLVLVGVFLARRRLWYDATLLVGLENLLVFVPFILISQAALMDAPMAQAMCAAGGTAAILRFATLKRYFRELNLPGSLLAAGFLLLALNVALPLGYRHFGETKIGIHIESGPAYQMNECAWLLILPAALALANLLPRAPAAGTLLPRHGWLPAGLFSLWMLVTGVHLYGLDYVYQFEFRCELFAPVTWVLAWTLWLRVPATFCRGKSALLFSVLLAPWLAAAPGGERTFLVLTALNLAIYVFVCWARRNAAAGHLAYASALMLAGFLPDHWLHFVAPGMTPADCVLAGLVAYVVFWTAWLPNPKLALLGSIVFGATILAVFQQSAGAAHWAMQGALVFLLLHSLRWNDAANPGATLTRQLAGLAWGMASFVWANSEVGRFWMPLIPGALVLGVYYAALIRRGKWRLFVVPAAALLVLVSGPVSFGLHALCLAPLGLLAVIASFMLLGFGTVAALTRDLWHRHEPHVKTAPAQPRSGAS